MAWDPGQAENTEETRLRMLAEDVAWTNWAAARRSWIKGLSAEGPARINPHP